MAGSVNQAISDFYRVAQQNDFARDVNFRLLSISSDATTATFDEDDLVYIRTAVLPGRAITNVPVPYMGLKFNIPGTATYPGSDGYELNFYCDVKSKLRQSFEQWSRDIFDDADSTGNYFTPTANATIDMVQLDFQLNPVAQYQLVGVAVNDVGALTYNISEGTGQVVQFTAKVSYHFWTRKSP